MNIALGIDTGGTYTDAVLVTQESGKVLAATKALTTHRDLAIGIREAIKGVFEADARVNGSGAAGITPQDVTLVGLSTTLATNAIVEGQGSPICLILIGYDRELIENQEFEEELVTEDVVYLAGGHTIDGEEQEPLDEAAAREAIRARRDRVGAFAVSGYFSVRNPEHELRLKALIEELTVDERGVPLPVTCGHELTTKLNAIRRATTVALNARLIPTLRELILTVRSMLDEASVRAPLMIVKGDGSLVSAEWAIRRPIETILSGPAASVVGAWHIAGRKDVWVVDVGGTTTDIAALRDGRPRLNPQGAQVGRWRTMIEAADVHTVGLGGDSHVRFGTNGEGSGVPVSAHPVVVGPQRVLPLCRLATEYPEIIAELRHQHHVKKRPLLPLVAQFLAPRRAPSEQLTETDHALLERLATGPIALVSLAEDPIYKTFLMDRVNRLVGQQVAIRAAFTPTDALHVLGRFRLWDSDAAWLGAELLAAQAGLSPEAFCERVVDAVSHRVSTELVTKILDDEIGAADWSEQPVAAGLLVRALDLVQETDLGCHLTLRRPIVAVGAPVGAYMPRAAAALHTDLILPENAGVANAIGAVVGSVMQRARVLIRPIDFGTFYRVHFPGSMGINGGTKDFDSVDACVAYAEATVPERLRLLAEQAGARHVEIHSTRTDQTGPIREKVDEEIYLGSVLEYTATGRPATTSAE
ncbi:MAG: hydantoinase/oxoprolinase N-terminal domain-containing protein [Anaerolineae bacterium]